MMFSIHGLPISIKYHDLKVLVRQECNNVINDFILDNLVGDGDGSKKVRIGVTDEREGAYLMKCLDGYRMQGSVLRVIPVGKTTVINDQQQSYDQRGFPPHNNFPNQGGDYNRPVEPMPGRQDQWGPGGGAKWGPSEPQNNYAFQQGGPGVGQPSYGQQQSVTRRPYEQRETFPAAAPVRGAPDQRYQQPGFAKGPEPQASQPQRRVEGRPHVLRSVELIDEPLSRPIAPARAYPPAHPRDASHKPLTIMKDNFQGPPYNVDRQATAPGYQVPGHAVQGSSSRWDQSIDQEKDKPFPKPGQTSYDRKYPEPDKRQAMGIDTSRNRHDNYNKPFDKGNEHRFSPRREILKDGSDTRFAPRMDIPKDGPRFSPRRDVPKDGPGPRFSPRRDIKDGPRFSPRREIPKSGHGPRFSPRRDMKEGPRFSPRRDIPAAGHGPRFSPRRDMKEGPRFSPRRDVIKTGPGPRFSPRRDMKEGPRFSPRRDTTEAVSGPRFSPRREMKEGPRFSPRRDSLKLGSGPRFSPRRDMKEGPRFSPRRDISKEGPRFSPRRDISKEGPRFSPRKDGPRFSPRKDGPRFSPRKDGPRFSPRKEGPRFSPRKDGPRFSPRKDVPRFSPRRDIPKEISGPRFSPRRDVPPGRRESPGRRMSEMDRRGPRHESPPPGLKRVSPGRGRRESPSRLGARYSPTRRLHEKPDKYSSLEAVRASKDIRPAYEPPSQAPNQAMYSGSYRPAAQESIQYSLQDHPSRERASRWQQEKSFPTEMKKDDDRRDVPRVPKFEPRMDRRVLDANIERKRSRSPPRSRSPLVRDRSPLRYKKGSSPPSPRRSWALEKRRSPEMRDAPPPPMWPGQNLDEEHQFRKRPFTEGPSDTGKRKPVWEPPAYDEKADRHRREIEERRFPNENPVRVRTDLGMVQPVGSTTHAPHMETRGFPQPKFEPRIIEPTFSPRDREPKFEPRQHVPKFEPRQHVPKFELRQHDPKFEPREREPNFVSRTREPVFEPRLEVSERRTEFHRQEERDFNRPDFRDREGYQEAAHNRERREEIPRREEKKFPKIQNTLDKELEDVYKRAVEFSKKAEEFRKSNDRARDEYHKERGRPDSKDYDNQKFQRPEERNRDDREEYRRQEERRRNEEFDKRESDWQTDLKRKQSISATIKAKREKAVEDIGGRILEKHGSKISPDMRRHIYEELKQKLMRHLTDIYGDEDVSFIEMVVKFNAKYDSKAEMKMLDEVMSGLPSHFRGMKRQAEETVRPEVPAKTSRHSHESKLKRDEPSSALQAPPIVPEWNVKPSGFQMMGVPHFEMVPQMTPLQMPMVMNPMIIPPPTFLPAFDEVPAHTSSHQQTKADDDVYNLYLCKDDFEPYSDNQADYLKRFLVSQIIQVSQTGQAPDFTVRGLQSRYRYEIVTRDDSTRDWIVNLDFSEFKLFNVLVYTKEELWYERAAIWLPGHSRCRNIEPLAKLELQNKNLEGVNIGKWKFVKKVVTLKGTRMYVDMPPSSARALEKNKMMLSYELQKVSVFLKAVAVDKDAFDAGLKESSVTDSTEIVAAALNSPMPSLPPEPNIIKITLKGNKSLSLVQARKIKEMLIYNIYKHQQEYDTDKTDFVKYGFCHPGYFGVVPENNGSKKWLMKLDMGKLKRHAIVVLGAEDCSTKYINMKVLIRKEGNVSIPLIMERLKQSNQGVKGLNFNLWKPRNLIDVKTKLKLEVDVDLESMERIVKLNYKLDYLDSRQELHFATFKYDGSYSKLEELIKKYKAEMHDSYDVANMDLASSDEEDDSDDIIFMGEFKAK